VSANSRVIVWFVGDRGRDVTVVKGLLEFVSYSVWTNCLRYKSTVNGLGNKGINNFEKLLVESPQLSVAKLIALSLNRFALIRRPRISYHATCPFLLTSHNISLHSYDSIWNPHLIFLAMPHPLGFRSNNPSGYELSIGSRA